MSKLDTKQILDNLVKATNNQSDPEMNAIPIGMAEDLITALISTEVAKAKTEQIMQDFLTLIVDIDVDESILIDWRERQLAEVESNGA